MKKLNLLIGILIGLTILSCSSDENTTEDFLNCINENESSLNNEFMYECNTFSTEIGRINMNEGAPNQNTSCMLEFHNTNFQNTSAQSNVNIISIWISLPSEYYYLEELAEGTYIHSEENNNNSDLRIVTLFRVGPNVEIIEEYDNLILNGLVIGQPDIYDFSEVIVDKLETGEFDITYRFETEGKVVAGHFRGFLSFVDNWA